VGRWMSVCGWVGDWGGRQGILEEEKEVEENKTDDEGVDGVFACVLTWQNAAPARPFRHSLLGAAFVIDRVTSTR
jgi:hypothetical protein